MGVLRRFRVERWGWFGRGWGRVLEESVEVAGDVSFEAASGFAGGFSLADAFGDVGPGFGAVPSAGDGDGVEGAVELAVTVAA